MSDGLNDFEKPDSVIWDEIKMLVCCSNLSFREVGERYDMKGNTIQKRADREGWPTPANLKKQALGEQLPVPIKPAKEPKEALEALAKEPDVNKAI